jgi:hypothetical protein
MCEAGAACTSYSPGHAVHLIQARLASAMPSEWVDAIVESVDAGAQVLEIRDFATGRTRSFWNGAGATDVVSVGEPVAVHGRYHVLARGPQWFNVVAF